MKEVKLAAFEEFEEKANLLLEEMLDDVGCFVDDIEKLGKQMVVSELVEEGFTVKKE